MRTCVGCRRVAAVSQLVRVTSAPGDGLRVGGPGRGAWLCSSSPRCLDRAARGQALSKALRTEVAPHAVDTLRELLEQGGFGPGAVCEDVTPA